MPTIKFQITITQSGIYYSKKLITEFYYLDLVLQDTPIYNEEHFNEISKYFTSPDSYGKRALDKRIKCVESFSKYLESEEAKEKLYSVNTEVKAIEMNITDFILRGNLSRKLKQLNERYIKDIVIDISDQHTK